MLHVPVWLLISGGCVLFVPLVYFVYDKYCKDQDGGPLIKKAATCMVITCLLCGLVWAVVGFLWVFGTFKDHPTCGRNSGTGTYEFAFATLIILNMIMDVWICFKICVVLYWAFSDD